MIYILLVFQLLEFYNKRKSLTFVSDFYDVKQDGVVRNSFFSVSNFDILILDVL